MIKTARYPFRKLSRRNKFYSLWAFSVKLADTGNKSDHISCQSIMICKKCKVHSILIFNILTFLQPIKFLLRNCESVTISLRKFRFFFFISNVPLVSYQFSFFVFSNDVIERWTGLCQNNEAMALEFFLDPKISILTRLRGIFCHPSLNVSGYKYADMNDNITKIRNIDVDEVLSIP